MKDAGEAKEAKAAVARAEKQVVELTVGRCRMSLCWPRLKSAL